MTIAPEATTIINDYIDRVRMALPLAPSTRLAVADRLYHDIVTACAAKAHDAGRATIDADIVRAHLETLGTPENCANALSAAFQAGTSASRPRNSRASQRRKASGSPAPPWIRSRARSTSRRANCAPPRRISKPGNSAAGRKPKKPCA